MDWALQNYLKINMANHSIKGQSPRYVCGESAPKERVDQGITRQLLGFGPDLMAVRVWFDEGAIGYQHHHHHTQVSYVESGIFEATIEGETKVLKAGDAFYVASNEMHGAVCKQAGVLIDIFSPQREDFLEETDED